MEEGLEVVVVVDEEIDGDTSSGDRDGCEGEDNEGREE